jgi:hypothetical protein
MPWITKNLQIRNRRVRSEIIDLINDHTPYIANGEGDIIVIEYKCQDEELDFGLLDDLVRSLKAIAKD